LTNQTLKIGTILITGISAAGKTTLGRRLFQDLKNSNVDNLTLLDGEETRLIFEKKGIHFGYSMQDRYNHTIEIAHMAKECNDQGRNAIVCAIAPCKDAREKMRMLIGNMLEVYLDCPVEVCAQRDYKNNYNKAYQGLYDTFIGVTNPYEFSANPELTLHTGVENVEVCSEILLKNALTFLKNSSG
tara:strand:- start:86 stop:643 length:558 start_codon:yes stop_codon:yes gene_type:complete